MHGAREVGLLQDEKGSIVKGCEDKYRALIEFAGSLVKKSSPSLQGFHFTALSIRKAGTGRWQLQMLRNSWAASRVTLNLMARGSSSLGQKRDL